MIRPSATEKSTLAATLPSHRRRFLGQTGGLAAAGLLGTSIAPIAGAMVKPDSNQLQAVLDKAVAAKDVPFAVAMLGTASGVSWSGAAGEARPDLPAGPETMFRIFSMTKAVGSLAAMMLIDRGKLAMDTPVEEILPAFGKLRVLDGFNGDEPILRAPKRKATVRHLATHTSGLVYDLWNEKMQKYVAQTKFPSVLSGTRESLNMPLAFDPGDQWGYGIGIDWLGLMVEAVDGRRINQFCQQEILDPLEMTNTRFELTEADQAKLAVVMARTETGDLAPIDLAPPPNPEVYGMGHCLYASAPDYLRFITLILNEGRAGGKQLISKNAVREMSANQIGSVRMRTMKTTGAPISADVKLFPGTEKTHSFGFLRNEEAVPGMRSAGSLGWAGICNTHYWIDTSAGIAAVIMTQSLPFVEPRFMQTYEAFERAVYAGNT